MTTKPESSAGESVVAGTTGTNGPLNTSSETLRAAGPDAQPTPSIHRGTPTVRRIVELEAELAAANARADLAEQNHKLMVNQWKAERTAREAAEQEVVELKQIRTEFAERNSVLFARDIESTQRAEAAESRCADLQAALEKWRAQGEDAEIVAAATHYVRCITEYRSPYISENGRHRQSPWAELCNAVTARAQTGEDAQDAERYRWLRDRSLGQWEHPIVVSQKRIERGIQYIGPLCGKDLDAAIDAARAQSGKATEQERK